MAFDMFAGDHHESIGHHEDFLLGLVEDDRARYPQLVSLRDAFYASPRISPCQAGALVHELIDLLSSNGGIANKALARIVVRLLPFFSRAYKNEHAIVCRSD